jgi:uncharacterized protein DUF6719
MDFYLSKPLLVFLLASIVNVAPATSQTTKIKPDLSKLSCGQKLILDDLSCKTGEILEITGSCLNSVPTDGSRPKGIQYNCMKRKMRL